MKVTIIRLIQKCLVDAGSYSGCIDGQCGPQTNKAVLETLILLSIQLPDDWMQWSTKRKEIAYIQLLCHQHEIDAGKMDGFFGPTTAAAVEQLLALFALGFIPRGFGDIKPVRVNPYNFPLDNNEALNEHYGKPCEVSLVSVPCPWTLRLDWDLRSTTQVIPIHNKLAKSLASILYKTLNIYGAEGIKHFGLDRYGGSMNCRPIRGSLSTWSTHAWGISVDWYPSKNKPGWDSRRASLAHPDLDPWWGLWEQEGWLSLGRTEDRDWMHIQAAKRG